jgi:integrase
VQKAAALTLAMLRQLLATCDTTARGRRNRALLLFGFAGALRRSELVALQVEDVALSRRRASPKPRPDRGSPGLTDL